MPCRATRPLTWTTCLTGDRRLRQRDASDSIGYFNCATSTASSNGSICQNCSIATGRCPQCRPRSQTSAQDAVSLLKPQPDKQNSLVELARDPRLIRCLIRKCLLPTAPHPIWHRAPIPSEAGEMVIAEQKDAASLAKLAVDCEAIMTNWVKVRVGHRRRAECKIIGVWESVWTISTWRPPPVAGSSSPTCPTMSGRSRRHALALLLTLARKTGVLSSRKQGPAATTTRVRGYEGSKGKRWHRRARQHGCRLAEKQCRCVARSNHRPHAKGYQELPPGVSWCEMDQLRGAITSSTSATPEQNISCRA